MKLTEKVFGTHSERELKMVYPIVDKIEAMRDSMMALSDEELRGKTKEYKNRLEEGETLDDLLPEAFATVREAARRTLGMEHYRVQLVGGVVLHQGRIAEMKTGEGKTLVSTLPAYLNALEGKGVHIVTVNDYLAKRDADEMGQIHRFLGLTVGVVLNDMKQDERRAAYNCDITYITNNELGFDYLRDNMVIYKEQLVQRGLHYAIIDEVDSVLIDEARTPLIISGQSGKSTSLYEACDILAKQLVRGEESQEFSKMDALMGIEVEESGDFIVNEKDKVVNLTQEGVKKVERFFKIENLADPENLEIQHNIILALRAHNLMFRDQDYVVQDDQVLIVDEFTGRIMPGRRYSDGLHQAIEAKEHVKVKRESKTLANITFQNFFNKYEKKAGMTGTALTEEKEFRDIYGMDVIAIPTNKPVIRVDLQDAVYKTKKEKYHAVVQEVIEAHKKGQPVLVGTITIDISEEISRLLKKEGIQHKVLNAKFHEMEAEIVADAGLHGAVTIATNMAGRGTDILLGGNPEFLAKRELRQNGMDELLIEAATGHEETSDDSVVKARAEYAEAYNRIKQETDKQHDAVVAAGGLHIIGTERHESRRIDNQLRGRAGRQGDPGSTRFYVSMEDDLMQRFGGERVRDLMQKISPDEDIPIEAGILTKQIEAAQKRVESYNFDIRKNVLQYDDVMNRQREIIYGQRRRVLMGEDIHDSIMEMVDETVSLRCAQFCPGSHPSSEWDMEGLRTEILNITAMDCGRDIAGITDAEKLQSAVKDFAHKAYRIKEDGLMQAAAQLGVEADMRELERVVLLRAVDEHWMDHIDAMDQLRQGISLQAIGQKDPVIAYRNAGFDMFDEMVQGIRERTVRNLYHVVISAGAPQRQQVAKPVETKGDAPARPKRIEGKISRNAPCPCGSGKKYKQCCGKDK